MVKQVVLSIGATINLGNYSNMSINAQVTVDVSEDEGINNALAEGRSVLQSAIEAQTQGLFERMTPTDVDLWRTRLGLDRVGDSQDTLSNLKSVTFE